MFGIKSRYILQIADNCHIFATVKAKKLPVKSKILLTRKLCYPILNKFTVYKFSTVEHLLVNTGVRTFDNSCTAGFFVEFNRSGGTDYSVSVA
jgi:hypothetical protein